MRNGGLLAGVLAAALLAAAPVDALAQKASISGQALWTGKAVPKDGVVVDAKTKGIAHVMVWLVDAEDSKKKLPLTPGARAWLAKNKEAEVVIGRPPAFNGHITPVVEGQALRLKNVSARVYNISLVGGAAGPNINPLIPPGKEHLHAGPIPARIFPIRYSCSIHAWMKGYLFAVPSPYFAVTKADGSFTIENLPKGKFKLMAWHEKGGWLLKTGAGSKNAGVLIDIKADGEIKVPRIEMSRAD